MAEGASASTSQGDITITVKGPSELKLSVTIAPSKSVAELKEEIASKSDVEKDRQRLIYSGKVLKDEDPISNYKIQTGHTIHMVKGAPKTAPAPSAAEAPRLPQMGTGLNVSGNPVDNVENIHHGLAGFNPFQGMGMNNLNDPNAMTGMMDNPEFLRSMSEMMARPEVVDQIISSNPQLAHMGPQIRQMMNNPMVRQMMSNPETLRMVLQMQNQMGGAGGAGGMGGMFGAGGGAGGAGGNDFANLFAQNAGAGGAGAATGTTPSTEGAAGAAAGATPGQGQAPQNPFAAMFGGGAGGGAGGAAGQMPFNPFMFGPGGFGGAGGAGGFGSPPPQDSRPAEEIYATQLGQLNGMGLWDAAKNIRALRRTGGNVEAAIELIFSGQVDN